MRVEECCCPNSVWMLARGGVGNDRAASGRAAGVRPTARTAHQAQQAGGIRTKPPIHGRLARDRRIMRCALAILGGSCCKHLRKELGRHAGGWPSTSCAEGMPEVEAKRPLSGRRRR
ncbi:hypothetical protein GOP47_0003422 [Adiantum capillus-veneris]|uniref:Uncharacterized protein n=1 Tax=Adiantum capillus-veneris TaxID=13818 RepID=A0A9D4ZQ23_ADICA|nr:hypothetical protein GOP47_0003422 [Adiantum capillus-veneris]